MILIDANNLSYISYHSVGELSYEEIPTGVLFGFLRSVLNIVDALQDNFVVFCWDSKKSFRKFMYPKYKMNRISKTEEEMEVKRIINRQMELLRKEILPEMGFNSNLTATGYEADDIIALCSTKNPCTIVSTDKDLFQLLTSDVVVYNPITKIKLTYDGFTDMYGIPPITWIMVKAIMGDKSDNIEGVKGVADKTAIKYIKGELNPGKIKARIDDSKAIIYRNQKLITLPFKYTKHKPFVRVIKNKFNRRSFIEVFDRYHFISFLDDDSFRKWEQNFNL